MSLPPVMIAPRGRNWSAVKTAEAHQVARDRLEHCPARTYPGFDVRSGRCWDFQDVDQIPRFGMSDSSDVIGARPRMSAGCTRRRLRCLAPHACPVVVGTYRSEGSIPDSG